MTYDNRGVGGVGGVDDVDDTRVVERERVVERPAERERVIERPVDTTPAGGQVNVSSGYATTTAGPGPLYYARRVISLLFGILLVIIALRIVLLLLGANAGNGLVDFIYGLSEPFVAPFRGIFSFDTVTPNGQQILDVAALVSLIGWGLIYLLFMAILGLADRRPA